MAVRLSISGARELAEGVWEAEVDPVDLRILDPGARDQGGPSVVLVKGPSRLVGREPMLEVNLTNLRVLNLASSRRTIFVADQVGSKEGGRDDAVAVESTELNAEIREFRPGDRAFVEATPFQMRSLAERLLRLIRREFPRGELIFKPRSGRFVETPDNWWTVKPQPVKKSFRFTVRARLEELEEVSPPMLARDRGASYSGFVMENDEQLPIILAALKRAARNRKD